jgi:hypothetical protein
MENQNEFKSDLIQKIINNKTIYDHSKLLSLLHDETSRTHVSIPNTYELSTIYSLIIPQNDPNNFNEYEHEPKKNYVSIINNLNRDDLEGQIANDMHHIYTYTKSQGECGNVFSGNMSSGKIARASAYVYVRYPEYRNMIDKKILDTLVFWNKIDPVDNIELIREAIVHKHQHNHNPFVLIPELIEIVFSQNFENYNNITSTNTNNIRDIFYHKHTKPKTQKLINKSIDQRLPSVDQRLPSVDQRLPSVDQRLPSVDQRLPSVDQSLPSIDKLIDKLKTKALRNLRSIQTSKTKKDRDKLKKRYKKIKKQLITLEKTLN